MRVTAVANGGPAATAEIVAGDLLEQLAGQKLASAADLQRQLGRLALPVAVFLVSGDTGGGGDPGPRWVAVPVKK